jgi:hypothetical protein
LEAQAEARRKEMQARIDNMLRSAYVLPPLPQLPAPMPEMMAPVMEPLPQLPVPMPEMMAPVMEPRPPLMMEPLPPLPMMPPVDPGFVMDIPTFRPPVRDTTPDFEMQPPMPTPAPMLIEPPVRVVQPKTTSYVPAHSPLKPPPNPGEIGYLQPPMPVDPGFVMDIPTFQPPVMSPTMAPPPLQNLGEVLQRIQQKQPPEMPPVDPGFVIGPREPTGPIPTYYDPAPPMLAPPAQPSAGMGLSRPTPEPYTPPMAEPYTPPSMQFSVDMPRMDYARDLYGVIPDNVSMLKRGGLAVKPKKGKC